jgi:hypothetical protein
MAELVTDPNLINQLNGIAEKEEASKLPSGAEKVTDQDLIAKLNKPSQEQIDITKTEGLARAFPLASTAMKAMGGVFEKAADWYTGTKTTEFPEMEGFYTSNKAQEAMKNLTIGQKAAIVAGPLITSDQKMQADIIKYNMDGSDITQDKFGNPIIVLNDGKTFYLNKPGMDLEDVSQFTSQLLQYLPGASAISKKLAGQYLARTAAQGAYGGALSIGQDVAAGQLAGKTVPGSIDYQKAAISTAVPAAVELIGTPLINIAFNKLATNSKFFTVNPTSGAATLTEEGIAAARAANIDVEAMGKDELNKIFTQIRTGDKGILAKMASEDSGFGFELSKAQAAGDTNQLKFFYGALKGEYGGRLQEMANHYLESQNLKIGTSFRTILNKFSKGELDLKSLDEAGESVRNAVINNYKKASDKVQTAYNAVDKNAIFTGSASNADNLVVSAYKAIQDEGTGIINADTPATINALKEIKDFIKKLKSGASVEEGGTVKYVNPTTFKDFESIRRRISSLYSTAKNSADGRNVLAIKQEFNKFYDDAIDNALFGSGNNQEAITAIRSARDAFKVKKELFGDLSRKKDGFKIQDPAASIVGKILHDPDVTPKETINHIFGTSEAGAKPVALQVVRRLKTIFGVKDLENATANEDFQQLRNALIQRTYEKSINAKTGTFSADTLVSNWGKLIKNNSDLMKELFTEGELNTFKQFIDQVRKTLKPSDLNNLADTRSMFTRTLQEAGRGVLGALTLKEYGINALLATRNVFDRAVESVYLTEGRKKVLEQLGKYRQKGITTATDAGELPFVGKAIKNLFENNKGTLPGTSYKLPTPSVTDLMSSFTSAGFKGRQQDLGATLIPTELAKRGIAKTKAPTVQPQSPANQPRSEVPTLDRNIMTASTTPTAGSITNIPQEQLDKYTSLFGKVV